MLTDNNEKALDIIFDIVLDLNKNQRIMPEVKLDKSKNMLEAAMTAIKDSENPNYTFKCFSEKIGDGSLHYSIKEVEYLTDKVYETDDWDLMELWILNVENELGFKIIDKLMNEEVIDEKLLLVLPKYYQDYVIVKIINLNKEKEYALGFCEKVDVNNVLMVDKLIATLGVNVNSLEHESMLNLLLSGSKYFDTIIRSNDFSKEELFKVLKALINNNLYMLLFKYSSYLITGNKLKIVSDEEIINNDDIMNLIRVKK